MPTIECDPDEAKATLASHGIEILSGKTPHERWRARHGDANVIGYDDVVVVQGKSPHEITSILTPSSGRAYVYFDGASRGNPGPSAIGWVIVSGDGIVAEEGKKIGHHTNNEAEYEALIRALKAALDHGFKSIDVRGDSELVVKQIKGEYRTNAPGLKERRVGVYELLDNFEDWKITHVPREINDRADKLANEALDQ